MNTDKTQMGRPHRYFIFETIALLIAMLCSGCITHQDIADDRR